MKPILFSKRLQKLADKKNFSDLKRLSVKLFSIEDMEIEYRENGGKTHEECYEDAKANFERGVKLAYSLAKQGQILYILEDLDDDTGIAYIAAKNLADAIAKVEKLPNRE